MIEDRAAVLREADFLGVYASFPLAQIERRVGPWRAGIGRTDPVWPLVTMRGGDHDPQNRPSAGLNVSPPLPMTSNYDELAIELMAAPVRLEWLSFWIHIADRELSQMWTENLQSAGAKLATTPDSAQVWLTDEFCSDNQRAAKAYCVYLTTAPWLLSTTANEVAFSTSAPPWIAMQHLSQLRERCDHEAD